MESLSGMQIQYVKTLYCTNIHYSTVQYSTVQYSTLQYSTLQYSTLQYSTHIRTTCDIAVCFGLHPLGIEPNKNLPNTLIKLLQSDKRVPVRYQ